jgi:hypothetical protein
MIRYGLRIGGIGVKTLVAIFQLPIVILNVFGFIVSGIWLVVIGQWKSVVAGIAVSIIAPTFLAFAMMPGMLIAGPGIYFANRGVTIGVYVFGFLSRTYLKIV